PLFRSAGTGVEDSLNFACPWRAIQVMLKHPATVGESGLELPFAKNRIQEGGRDSLPHCQCKSVQEPPMKSRSAVVPVSPSARFHPSADNHARSNGQSAVQEKVYVLDTNVLIHDPNSVLNFEENRVVIPMTVLEELDHLKNGKASAAADCRAAI